MFWFLESNHEDYEAPFGLHEGECAVPTGESRQRM